VNKHDSLFCEKANSNLREKEASAAMFGAYLKSLENYIMPLLTLMADSDAGGSIPNAKEVDERIKTSKNRRIPVVKLILLLVVIIVTIVLLERYM
jgi:hypothetical protein